MSHYDRLHAELQSLLTRFADARPMARLQAGEVGVPHYASHLRENYFQLRERPVVLALAATRLTASAPALKLLHRRAIEEIHHDKLALKDLRTLGVDTAGIETAMPLPETTALLAFGHYQVERLNPVSIVGWMVYLDFVPMYASSEIAGLLEAIGVPGDAMSALEDHETVGPAHEQAMRVYVDELIRTPQDLDAALYAMDATAALFSRMVEAAFDAVDRAG